MPHEPYLVRLINRLQAGCAHWEQARRMRHVAFVRSQTAGDGGLRGRSLECDDDDPEQSPETEPGDLYYTAFGVRTLVVLDCWTADDAQKVAAFLRRHSGRWAGIVDLISWLTCAVWVQAASGIDLTADLGAQWDSRISQKLEQFRTSDGGYAKRAAGAMGSTYHSFLAATAYELLGRQPPDPDRLIAFVRSRQRDDGGFVEMAPMRHSGTNPTAAAVALLRMLGAVEEQLAGDVARFLHSVYSPEGGFAANQRIPFADGLSTFTALVTCEDLGLTGLYQSAKVRRFVESLERPRGGFCGAAWDNDCDVEYTFYGVGSLAQLETLAAPAQD